MGRNRLRSLTDSIAAIRAPAVPGAPTIAVQSGTEVAVSWTDVASEDTYELEIKPSGGAFGPVPFSPLVADFVDFTMIGLTRGVEYCFRLRATNAGAASDYSPEACATTSVVPALTVSGVVAGSSVPGVLDESWLAPLDDGGSPVVDYRVQTLE